MDYIPADVTDSAKLADMDVDVRAVSVIWRGDQPYPVVDYHGCSAYEAEGLLRAALKRISRDNADSVVFLEEELELQDDYDDDEGDY